MCKWANELRGTEATGCCETVGGGGSDPVLVLGAMGVCFLGPACPTSVAGVPGRRTCGSALWTLGTPPVECGTRRRPELREVSRFPPRCLLAGLEDQPRPACAEQVQELEMGGS